MKKQHFLISIIILVSFYTAYGQTFIGGEISTTTLEASGNPYLVDSTLIIAIGDTLTLKKGVSLLFNNFTGLEVFGCLIVDGEENEPVVFSSINDSNYNPKATLLPSSFDWNGITIDTKSGAIKLNNIKVSYSVFGIKSFNSKMTLKYGVFQQNGQYNLIINDYLQEVKDGIPFSYSYQKEQISDTLKINNDQLFLYEQKLKNKRVLVFTTLGTGTISGGLCGFFAVKWGEWHNKYNSMGSGDFNATKNKAILNGSLTITTGVLSAACLITSLKIQLTPVNTQSDSKPDNPKGEKNRKEKTGMHIEISPSKAALVYNF
jgi:hypothetical protein